MTSDDGRIDPPPVAFPPAHGMEHTLRIRACNDPKSLFGRCFAYRANNGRRQQLSAAEAESGMLRDVLDFRLSADGILAPASDACTSSSAGVSCSCAWPGQRIYTLAAHPGAVLSRLLHIVYKTVCMVCQTQAKSESPCLYGTKSRETLNKATPTRRNWSQRCRSGKHLDRAASTRAMCSSGGQQHRTHVHALDPAAPAASGLAVLPGALTAAEQRRIVRDALTAFVEPPNRTNHTAHLGPLPGLWDASLQVRPSP